MVNICLDHNLILVKLITFLIIFKINEIKGESKVCGIPGNSLKSLIKPALTNDKIVDNGVKVKYSCDYNDAPFLIGYSERECVDGDWTQTMPKCATLYTGNYVQNTTLNSNAINISLANSARISGLVLRVSSYDPIEVMNIKNIPSPECFKANTTIRDKVPFHSTRKRYTTLFHCPTKDANFWMHSEVNWILITFSEKIKNCEQNSCPAELEFIELYETINDECLKPDVPAFGKIVPVKRNNAVVRYKYECEDFFVMQERKTTEVVCTQYEEWSPKKLPKCVPNITCDVEPVDELKISYNWLWNEMEAVVGTIATFECVNNYTKINGSAKRECRPNGEWSEELPHCLPFTATTADTTTAITPISFVTTTVSPYAVSQQSNNVVYPTNPSFIPPSNSHPNPYPTHNVNPYPTPYPNPYQTPYPTPYPPQIYNPPVNTSPNIPAMNDQNTNNSLNATHFVYIFLGILLGILITIGVIYYFQKRRRDSYGNESGRRGGQHNRTPIRDEVFYDHMNHINNFNESQISNTCLADETANTPYDSSGYIQIEAVEALRMDSFKKYENYDSNKSRHKPLPAIPK